jgi:subtilisin family serine protease
MLRPSDVSLLERSTSVSYARPGFRFLPDNDISRVETGSQLLHAGFVTGTVYKGKGAIVLVYDTGIDWKHLDFRSPTDTTKSRVLFIWDQTITAGAGETPPSGFSYGVEYTQAQIQNEIDGTPAGFVREKDNNGHGTHVTGTAAGNGVTFGKFTGEAPEADIIFVKGGESSFSETRMIDGMTYAANKAAALGKPIAVNWSLGGMWGTHDATDPVSVAVDDFSSLPGRVHVNSAGNSGNSLIHVEEDAAGSKSFTITFPHIRAQPGHTMMRSDLFSGSMQPTR